ncbi:dTDP-4-dehydrorhamnose reductase [Azotobacter salinestris]|uniref:dTDP-4-dehydrorhamnose reductase n=1 Tax=Azotobacter salinestris TaxID=69964 RepID=UPI0032DE4C62
MRILLLGRNGQVGWELQRALAPLGELVALDRHGGQGLCGDLADLDALAATVRKIAPDAIVNAAAYTAVDKAESEPELALRINGEAPGLLAREAARLGAWLVHYSTDYVFDGSGEQPWREEAPTGPLSVYGRSKLAGELAIAASGARALVFRTSWVYAARGGNFARTMLRLARERDQLRVIADQIGAPTGAELIADVTAHALRQAMGSADGATLGGVYHLAAAGETSWCEYARFVLHQAEQAGEPLKVGHGQIEAIPTSAYPTPAQRPLNSRLDTRKLRETFGLHLPHWQVGVARMLTETRN